MLCCSGSRCITAVYCRFGSLRSITLRWACRDSHLDAEDHDCERDVPPVVYQYEAANQHEGGYRSGFEGSELALLGLQRAQGAEVRVQKKRLLLEHVVASFAYQARKRTK